MKNSKIVFLILCWPVFSWSQTNYYYKGSGALSTTTNWGQNTDGTGTAPTNFTTNNQIFNIRNTSSVSLTTAWTVSGTSSQVVVENGVTLTTSTGSNLTIGASTKLIINNGGITQSDVAITINASGTFQVDNGGTYIHNNTTATSSSIFQGTESFGATSNIKINNWSAVGTAVTNAVILPFGNLEINWTGNTGTWQQGWTGSINLCAGDYKITSTGSGSMANTTNNAYTITISGDYIVNGGTIDLGTNNGANTIADFNIAGNITQTAGTYTRTGNAMFLRLNATGTGTNTWTFSGGTRLLMLYTVALGKTINLASNFAMGSGVGSTQILLITGTLDAVTYIISNGSAGQGITNNGILKTSNTNGLAGSSSTTISNAVSITLYIGTNSTIEYYAAGSQNVTAATVYENVIINGGGTKTLQGASTINKALTLTSGKLDIQDYVLTIPSTGSVDSYTSSNYIVTGSGTGRLRQEGVTSSNYNTTKYFPIGTASCYLPAATNPTATSDFTANVFTGATTNGLSGGTAWTIAQKKGMVDAVWNVERKSDRIAISGTAVNTFQWDNCYSSLEGTDFTAASNSNIGIWRWVSGTNWSLSSANFTSNNSAGSNTSTNNASATYPGPYIVAVITGPLANNRFIKFDVMPVNDDWVLNWSVDNPVDLKYFEVEKSKNAVDFYPVIKVGGEQKNDYGYTDINAGGGIIYYRIKMYTASGNFYYSRIIPVSGNLKSKIRINNNPVTGILVFQHPQAKQAEYRIISMEGKQLIKKKIAANTFITTDNVGMLSKGIYLLQYTDGAEIITERLIKQ